MSARFAMTRTFAVLVIGLATLGVVYTGDQPVSKFTSTAEKKAIKFHREKDEPSDFRGLYRGFGDYDLEWVGGDERSWINIRFRNSTVDLRDATMELGAGIGFFPHKANDKVEWRGIERAGQFTPFALIYRIVGLTENGKPSKTRLIVIKLDGARSRIAGHAEGPNEDVEARQIADQLQPTK